jgi:hypothetical protein
MRLARLDIYKNPTTLLSMTTTYMIIRAIGAYSFGILIGVIMFAIAGIPIL